MNKFSSKLCSQRILFKHSNTLLFKTYLNITNDTELKHLANINLDFKGSLGDPKSESCWSHKHHHKDRNSPTSLLPTEPPTCSAPAPCQKSNHHHQQPHFPQGLAGSDPDEATVVVAQQLLVRMNLMHHV